jgi:hypothetical protein
VCWQSCTLPATLLIASHPFALCFTAATGGTAGMQAPVALAVLLEVRRCWLLFLLLRITLVHMVFFWLQCHFVHMTQLTVMYPAEALMKDWSEKLHSERLQVRLHAGWQSFPCLFPLD